ncbi:MAG: hypothetical protein AB8G22_28040 [Saprospiraceae bacterium]
MNNTANFEDRSITQRTSIFGIIILLALFIGIFFSTNWLVELLPKWHLAALTGLRLFAIWLIITSILRSISSLRKGIHGSWLLLAGMLTTGISLVFYWMFLFALREIRLEKVDAYNSFSWERIVFFTGIGLLVSVLTLINLRIKNRTLGNLLEVILIGGVIAGIVYLGR